MEKYFGSHCRYDELIGAIQSNSFSRLEKFHKWILTKKNGMGYPNYFCIDMDNGQLYPVSLTVNGITTTSPIYIRIFCDAVTKGEDPFDFIDLQKYRDENGNFKWRPLTTD